MPQCHHRQRPERLGQVDRAGPDRHRLATEHVDELRPSGPSGIATRVSDHADPSGAPPKAV